MRVYFLVPIDAKNFVPSTDKGVKTYVIGHGPIEQWGVGYTGQNTETEKLVFVYVPKTFVFLNGRSFYKLVHLQYKL